MAKFAGGKRQAGSVMKRLQGGAIRSVGTARNYEAALKRAADHLQAERLGSLQDMTPRGAVAYLQHRASVLGQKALDQERQALQAMMRHVTGRLDMNGRLPVIKSSASSKPNVGPGNLGQRLSEQSRIYTAAQVDLIAARQNTRNSLATRVAYHGGLRAHELITLQRLHKQLPDDRPTHLNKFRGVRENSIGYTVAGKGGLIREIRLPIGLARELESKRVQTPIAVTDRGVHYRQFYDIGGGQTWSKSFGEASKKALGWSKGAHGLRHSYAQSRMAKLQRTLTREEAKLVVSQELGHFRPDITEVYLR